MLHHVSPRSPQYQCGYFRHCGTVALPSQSVGDVHAWRGDDRMRMRRIVKHKTKGMRSNESLNKVHSKPVTDGFIMKMHLALAE